MTNSPRGFRVSVPDLAYWRKQIKCQDACPVHTDARGYITAIADGNLEKAYIIAREPNPFASICGRVCAAPCEVACRRGRQLYAQRGCVACHRSRGVGGVLGPDLTFVGSRKRDSVWHLRHFQDPQATSPGSTMPPFKHLPAEELKALTVYMLSLREMPSALLPGPRMASAPGRK